MTLKQISLHTSRLFRSAAVISLGMWAFGTMAPGVGSEAHAQQRVIPRNGEQMSVLRLVSGGGLHGTTYQAGVDLTMAPGSHTYWKIPGEAGVPPVFTFNGSSNVAAATVSFPVPTRISEEGIEAFGYTNGVVFPVAVTPEDRSRPAVLHVDVTYAVCNKICLPGHGEASLTLSPHAAAVGGAELASAIAKVPRAIPSAPALSIKRNAPSADPTGGANASAPSWTVTWTGTDQPTDIFPDAPEGFFFDTKKIGPAAWTLTAEQSVTTPKASSVAVTLVLARPEGSTSVVERIDLGTPTK